MAENRIYVVRATDNSVALVSAISQAAAIRHVVRGRYKAEVASGQEIAELVESGVKVQIGRDPALDVVGEAS